VATTGTDGIAKDFATNSLLSELIDHDANSLGITAGNIISFTGTQDGKGFSSSMAVGKDSTIGDILAMMRSVEAFNGASVGLNLMNGTISIAGKQGAKHDLSNLKLSATISANDSTPIGNFNRPLGEFQVVQQAQDAARNSSLSVQVGSNQGTTDSIDLNSADTAALRLTHVDVSTAAQAHWATAVIDNAMNQISNERAKLGAIQNRLENTAFNLNVFSENLTASESRIRDVDVARETMSYAKSGILSNASQAMLAQANMQSQQVLMLLR
jgi:flagellin